MIENICVKYMNNPKKQGWGLKYSVGFIESSSLQLMAMGFRDGLGQKVIIGIGLLYSLVCLCLYDKFPQPCYIFSNKYTEELKWTTGVWKLFLHVSIYCIVWACTFHSACGAQNELSVFVILSIDLATRLGSRHLFAH